MNFKAFVGIATIGVALVCVPASAQTRLKDDGTVTVVEYYNAAMDHYFMTSLGNEIALCDAGTPPCAGWVRTGASFRTWAPGTAGRPGGNTSDVKVCRLYNDQFAGKSTHFYAAQGGDCEATLADFPGWILETSELFDADVIAFPLSCAKFYKPLYRLYNNGMGGAPNHRFTVDYTIVQEMVAKGWAPEGPGLGVGMCLPGLP
ncbi:MAG: hypothetical protein ABI881_14620 [Betaproteobacteria bacterium]